MTPAHELATERQVTEVWQRISNWLAEHAPASHAALLPGLTDDAIELFERDLGVRIPVDLRALWRMCGGDSGTNRGGCMPGNMALMPREQIVGFYRQQINSQGSGWGADWIPVISNRVGDWAIGLYLETGTGMLGQWSRYGDTELDEADTVVTYLEEVADMLEYPALAARDLPGLVGGRLVWGDSLDPADDEAWRPLAG